MSLSFQNKLPNNSNEELLIRAQVDEIYQIEEKINLINDKLSKINTQNSFLKKIEELKLLRNNLIQKKIKLNEVFCSEMQKIANEIQEKFSLIKNIENNILSMKNELLNYNTLSFQNLKLRKYILANSAHYKDYESDDLECNFFLTENEINDIILDNVDLSKNSEIIKLKRDIEINKASEKVIINNYNEINSKIIQIQENLKMLKEEKNTTKYELINLISCKESLESIIKLNIGQLNIHKSNQLKNCQNIKENETNNDNNQIENNKWTKPNELFIYELQLIDSNKAAKLICNQLFDVFNINFEEDDDNISLNNNSKICRKTHDKNKSNDLTINSCMTIDDNTHINNKSNKKSKYNSFTEYDFTDGGNSFIIKNNKIPRYINNKNQFIRLKNNLSNISSLFNKNIIESYIQNELEKYISSEINSYKTIYEFLENLSIIIISKFQYVNIIISAETLTIYLSYVFKSLYYDMIINAKIKFINKDYKSTKKTYKNMIPVLLNELSKLETKFQEYKSKTEVIKKQIKLIENNEKNIDITKIKIIKLSKEEQNYIQICSKANSLNKERKGLEKILSEYEIKKNEIREENDEVANKINKEINNIDSEIVQINKEMKIEKNALNNDIENYKKIIKEKYNIINEQLQIYKDKYGSNLEIYNRLINSINSTIKKSSTKHPLIIINNNNINNSNIFSYDQKIFNKDINKINYKQNKVRKTLSDIDFLRPNIEKFKKSKEIKSSIISYRSKGFTDKREKKFCSINVIKRTNKIRNKNKKNENYNNISNIFQKDFINTDDRRYEKYNRYYNKYHQEDIQKSININPDNTYSEIKKYKSYSLATTSKSSRKNINRYNNFNNNIAKKKLGLFSIKKDKTIYYKKNWNTNISHSNYNSTFLNKTDLNKLNHTLQDLKDILSYKGVISNNNKFIEKIRPLTQTICCFFRNYCNLNNKINKVNKYNPLLNISPEILCGYPYNFIPGKLYLDINNNININILTINNNKSGSENYIINIDDIENTIVSSHLKLIIDIHRNFRKYKVSSEFISKEDFIEKEMDKNMGFTKEEIEKCINNKNYNFLIALKGKVIIELIICSYEEFKMWINGLAFLIKNKNEINQCLDNK